MELYGSTDRMRLWVNAGHVPQDIGESREQQALFEKDLTSVIDRAAAAHWLLENVVMANWAESVPVMIETFEGMGAPASVVAAIREMTVDED